MIKKFDFLVVGSGIAGMSFALKVADKGSVAILCKTTLEEANTALAQGGISSVTNPVLDNYEKHIQDTLIAGDGICDINAVEKVVKNAPQQIKQLLEWGVDFEKHRMVVLTYIERADIPNFEFSTTKILPERRYSNRL